MYSPVSIHGRVQGERPHQAVPYGRNGSAGRVVRVIVAPPIVAAAAPAVLTAFFLLTELTTLTLLTLSAMTAAASTSSDVGIRSRVSGAYCLLSRPTLVLLVVGVTPCAVFTAAGFAAALVPRVVVLVHAPLARDCESVAGVDLES